VQGATFADLRRESAQQLLEMDFPGYAVGGLAVGESHALTCEMTSETTRLLPRDRPRYLMGVGQPEQIADYVALGVDMRDCVLPTRAARHACLYTSEGRVLIKNARYAQDQGALDPRCSCAVCRRYSRAYLRHLFVAREMTAAILATYHNVHFYLDIMRQIRDSIEFGNLAKFSSAMHARFGQLPSGPEPVAR
jgi:queuine tRNA-ribosyltransferase